ncbi:MAG: ACP S-malonyltransferase [Candidatus Omnitrophica bacterium]|nr:ACP S-malonyltransferase [Candidatus Omnitrophota bacterium]
MAQTAFLFAGQGSQYIGMGKDLCEAFPESKAVFDSADEALHFSLSRLMFSGDPAMLKQTIMSQPAILTVSIAALEAFKSITKPHPLFMAGLSLGEYSALIAAGSLTFEDGLRLVRRRAEIMEDATCRYPGKMAAVLELGFDAVKDICLKTGAEIANLNAPGQIVISGKSEAVDAAAKSCQGQGAKRVIFLEVSGGFHSSLMFEASAELKLFLENTPVSAPAVPVVSNVTAMPQYRAGQIRENLIQQMYSPVKWEESMRYIISQGVTDFYEFGPGKVLKGLMRRIDSSIPVTGIEKKEDILNTVDSS